MERQLIIQNTTKQELLTDLAKVLEQRKEQQKLIKKDEVLYIPDVANRLKRSINHVRNLVRNKKIKFLQEKPGSVIMFRESHIEEYLQSLKTISKQAESEEISMFIKNPLSHGKRSNR